VGARGTNDKIFFERNAADAYKYPEIK